MLYCNCNSNNSLISCHRPIATLADLEFYLCTVEGLDNLKAKLPGPLGLNPVIMNLFGVPQDKAAARPPKVTLADLMLTAQRLHEEQQVQQQQLQQQHQHKGKKSRKGYGREFLPS